MTITVSYFIRYKTKKITSYLINNDKLSYVQDKIKNTPWDAFDMWVCNVARLRVGTAEKIYTKAKSNYANLLATLEYMRSWIATQRHISK